MATQPRTGEGEGPPSERKFVRVLRDHALETVEVEHSNGALGLTTAELEKRTGLSRPSISSLIRRFDAILEPAQTAGATRWAINPKAGVAIGIELDPELPPAVALADLYGRIADDDVLVAAAHPTTADEALDWVVGAIRTLLGKRPADDVVGVGVSVAAPIRRETGVIRAGLSLGREDPRWADWQVTRLREQLKDRLGWPELHVLLDNDANLNALAEYIWGVGRPSPLRDRPPYENIVYIEWSWGIGMGLILGGELYRGGGVAGEIGHTIVRGDDEQREGEPEQCERCGKRGCLETVAGLGTILKQVPSAPSQGSFTHQDFLDALEYGESLEGKKLEAYTEIFDYAANRVDRVLGPVIHLLNPELVIIGGEIGRFGYDAVKGELLQALKNYTMRPALADVAVVPAKLRKRPTLQGAVSLLLRPTPGDPDALLTFLQRKS